MPKTDCFQTISARSINEVFINNMIRISLSIHGGTSSVTYAYGTPNHLAHIDDSYRITQDSKKDVNTLKKVLQIYYSGRLEETDDLLTYDAPDQSALNSK